MSKTVNAIPSATKTVIKHKFSEDHEDPNTAQFLTASDGVREFLSSLGSTLFSPVTSDIKGNIDKLNNFVDKNPECVTLGDILRKEKKDFGESLSIQEKVGSDALLWLTRALDFVLLFLSLWIQDNQSGVKAENLSKYFQTSYEMTLKPYHSWIVQKVVNVILTAAPSRSSILTSLKGTQSDVEDDEVFADLEVHVLLLRGNIDSIRKLFQSVEYPWK